MKNIDVIRSAKEEDLIEILHEKNSTAMKDARILGVDVVESVSMIMAGILYETGLIRKIKIWMRYRK